MLFASMLKNSIGLLENSMYFPYLNFSQRYTSAFAFGLLENGFSSGDKLVLWADQTHSAEILVAQVNKFYSKLQVGASKAGVGIVTF